MFVYVADRLHVGGFEEKTQANDSRPNASRDHADIKMWFMSPK